MDKPVLDACCGSRMFWFDKSNPSVEFLDCRQLDTILCDGRKLVIEPDTLGDFRCMPYSDNSFSLVVFDPPHLAKAGDRSWLALKYGKLSSDWKTDLTQGFSECLRVLKPYGTLVFKWNEDQIKINEVVKLAPQKPLFGNRNGKTHWLVFMKEGDG